MGKLDGKVAVITEEQFHRAFSLNARGTPRQPVRHNGLISNANETE